MAEKLAFEIDKTSSIEDLHIDQFGGISRISDADLVKLKDKVYQLSVTLRVDNIQVDVDYRFLIANKQFPV